MKIVLISYGHIDPGSALVKYLIQKGHEVYFVIVGYGTRYFNSIADFDISNLTYGLHSLSIFENQSKDLNNLLHYLKGVNCLFLKLPSRSLHDTSNLKYIKSLANYVNELSPDVIHYNGDSAHQLVFYYLLRKYPSVYTIHDLIPHTGESSKLNLRNKFFRWLHYKCNYQFILHSEYYSEMMKKITGVKPKRINTVYFAPFDFYNYYMDGNVVNEDSSVLFFGRISKYKGLRYFFEAIPRISEVIKGCKFYVLGNGNIDIGIDLENIKKGNDVTIINRYIDNETLSRYIQKCSVVILPYTDATQSAVVLTAYAFNKPVIASRVGGIPEVVIDGKTGYLVEPCNSEQLAEKIIELLKDKEKLISLSNNIRKYRNNNEYRFFNWGIVANETIGVYEKAIKGKS